MIEANEIYVITELQDIGLNSEQIRELLKRFRGWRIYFRKKKNEYEEIKALYSQMLKSGVKRSEAVKQIAELFEKSENRIRIITRDKELLNEI